MRQLPQTRHASRAAVNGASATRVVAVRLTEIPIHIRRQYGQKLMDEAADNYNLMMGMQLSAAVERPSERVYWIPVTKKSAPSLRRIFGKDVA